MSALPTPDSLPLRKVLVIGSGPIVIGQAAEFDYAGTQACQALREEGLEVVLVNNNPATIMTDPDVADRVYIEPLTVPSLRAIIAKERPDGLLPTLGGQVGLNLAVDLAEAGVLHEFGVRLLGTPLDAIRQAEDRALFRNLMLSLNQPIPVSAIVESLDAALGFAGQVGLPLVVRPAFTLGGTGGGIAETLADLVDIVQRGLVASPVHQVLLERSVKGWKEIEYEVMRDANDTCITICNMENVDPVGVHTGDSIVVAPSQTLSDRDYQLLRAASITIVRALQIEGGCNVQFALHPTSGEYIVIEVNPRVSRSSALASKATGYPIARVAAKIAIGQHLHEIDNPITGVSRASFEPALDYLVVKLPRWPFDKFAQADRTLGTQMKATGEVMAIDRSFEGALQKALRSLEIGVDGLTLPQVTAMQTDELIARLQGPADDERLFVLAEALRRGIELEAIHGWTEIDRFFLGKLANLLAVETEWQACGSLEAVPVELIAKAKKLGFADSRLATLLGVDPNAVRRHRLALGVLPSYKTVDTCAAEYPALTPYFYSTYAGLDEAVETDRPTMLVLGSGPIRIGQGIEFDYCSVHAVWALKEAGYDVVMLNCNPETVSTDFDVASRLYFEPLTVEDVLNVIEREKALGVFVQFGGQTAINLAGPLADHGVRVFGTPVEAIDLAEDREKFRLLLAELGIAQPKGGSAHTLADGEALAAELGYPLMLRPSYVIGGRAMHIAWDESDLQRHFADAASAGPGHPVLIDQYLPGKEVDVDAVCDGDSVFIPGLFEHIERAGVHSGDSMTVYPPQTLSEPEIAEVTRIVLAVTKAIGVIGLINVQLVIADGRVHVLEVNPRASRTAPVIAKITGVPLLKLATLVQLGKSLIELGYPEGLQADAPLVAVKAPVFSFAKLLGLDALLGPEMRSTGEALGIARDLAGALAKVFPKAKEAASQAPGVLFAVSDRDKAAIQPLVTAFERQGWRVFATPGTAKALQESGFGSVEAVEPDLDAVRALVKEKQIGLVLNLPTNGNDPERWGFSLRRLAVEYGVPCLTAIETAGAFLESLGASNTAPYTLDEYLQAPMEAPKAHV